MAFILIFLIVDLVFGDPIFQELSSFDKPSHVIILRTADHNTKSFPPIGLGHFIWDISYPKECCSTNCIPWKQYVNKICVDKGFFMLNKRKKQIIMVNAPMITEMDGIGGVDIVMNFFEEKLQYANVFIIALQNFEIETSMKKMLSALQNKFRDKFWDHVIIISFISNSRIKSNVLDIWRTNFSHFVEKEYNVSKKLPFLHLDPFPINNIISFKNSSESLKRFILSKGQLQFKVNDFDSEREKRNYKDAIFTLMMKLFNEQMVKIKGAFNNESLIIQTNELEGFKLSLIGDSLLLVGFSIIVVIVKYFEFRRKRLNNNTINDC